MKTNLKQLSESELKGFIKQLGQPSYRANQIINWIYKKMATSFDDMTNLSKELRENLKDIAVVGNLNLVQRQVSKDGTEKFLFELEDGETIESVLIPNNSPPVNSSLARAYTGELKERFTLCISSQAGCALGCRFCMTGRLGLKRNLRAYEIVDQVLAVSRLIEQKPITPPLLRGDTGGKKRQTREKSGITNIVFMGMGEPFNNFDQVVLALWNITGLMGFSKRRVTVSTAGIIPGIKKLPEKGPDVNLAISLNATTDETRNMIMPINKKYPLKQLIKACKEFPLPPNRRITFEYVLLDEINDSTEDAHRLVKLLKGIRSKVNLIPYNPPPNTPINYNKPADDKILEFQGILYKAGLTVIIRKSKGADISAACGQLRAAYV
jgi:23S rRNA (adenine2503-C2)-methyltransferase